VQDSYVVDRIEEGQWAVLEAPDGRTFPVPRFWLPETVREGDALRISVDLDSAAGGGSVLHIEVDEAERRRREGTIAALRDRLQRGPSGDLEL
jgi:hypothetical protein